MNITTIGNIPSSKLQRIKGRYVAAAAGVAIAIAVMLAVGDGSASNEMMHAPQTARITVSRNLDVPQQYFYIVATEAQRSTLIHDGEPNVVLAGSTSHDLLISEGTREMIAFGAPFTIVDLTQSALSVNSQATRNAFEGDDRAGVLSSELAHFGN
jgi:hypothetical protein